MKVIYEGIIRFLMSSSRAALALVTLFLGEMI
jgi:hypothetical protein